MYVKIVGRAGNRRIYGKTAMRTAGFPHLVRVVGRSDTEAPAVRFLSIQPSKVDTTVDDQKLLVDVSATESTSGVEHVALRLRGSESNQVLNYWTGFAHAGETALDGTWETLFWMPRCHAMSGVYDLLVRAVDAAGNSTDITVPAALEVTAADTSVSRPRMTTPSPPSRVQVSFPEDVTGLSTRSGLVTTHSNGTGPAEPGTWTCSGADGSAVDCEKDWLRSATFVPTEALSAGAAYGLVLNPEHVLDVRDRAGNAFRRDTTLFETSP